MALNPMLGVLYTGTGYPWDLTDGGVTDRDLAYLKSVGVVWIRPGIMPYSYSKNDVPNGYKEFIVFVKSRGFKVMTGVGAIITIPVTYSWWQAFKASIPAYAAWAQAAGIDVFCIGNEEASHIQLTGPDAITPQQIHDDERGVIALTAKTYYTGPILYTGSSGEMAEFLANGIGNIDILGHNQYDLIQNFTSKVAATLQAFGPSKLWVTEWNCEGGYNAVSTTAGGWNNENQFADLNMRRWHALEGLGLTQTFFFAYGGTNAPAGTNTTYGLISGTTFRSSPRVLRGQLLGAAGHGRQEYSL